jgi:hypothetical protein
VSINARVVVMRINVANDDKKGEPMLPFGVT